VSIIEDMKIDHRLLGLTNLLSIGNGHCSAGRQEMFSNHIQQARPVADAELPDIFSGFEALFSDYTFNSASIENDVKVLAVVNKFSVGAHNPLRTVIYRDLSNGEVAILISGDIVHIQTIMDMRMLSKLTFKLAISYAQIWRYTVHQIKRVMYISKE